IKTSHGDTGPRARPAVCVSRSSLLMKSHPVMGTRAGRAPGSLFTPGD
uniref:Uncharacterized protein n=1 Tax=Saimiri boliviensis boliviensis TaxID=39432 RepID=A0A2K6SWP0_SAIBB